MRNIARNFTIGSILILILIGVIIGLGITVRTSSVSKTIAETREPMIATSGREAGLEDAFTSVAKTVGPAVVSVVTETTQKLPMRMYYYGPQRNFFDDDFFKRFFGDVPEREFKQQGLGSGVIIDKEGYIITNDHVIGGADKITVILPDGRRFDGVLKGSDPRSDLAVIKIEAGNLPVARLGDSDTVKTGQWAIAIGNPFGFVVSNPSPTVTVGVVSALHRQLPLGRTEGRNYIDLIQTDAAINPGNSGGPLCDLNGDIIGLNVAIFSTTGGYQGIGFAIPANAIRHALQALIEGREVSYGWIGVTIQELSYDMAEYFKMKERKGVIVIDVVKDGPAEKAGIRSGDIITKYEGTEIDSLQTLLKYVGETQIGRKVDVGVLREGKEVHFAVTVEARPSEGEIAEGGPAEEGVGSEASKSWRGITVINITDETASKYGVEKQSGVLIVDIEVGSAAYRAGLVRGLVIKEVDRVLIRNTMDFNNVTDAASGKILVRTNRGYVILEGD
ncbi:MAG: Do family serine endopeptidase [Candidatus Omnitrophica bacterium]|nr:Do family serine endopeptidase [Candidatus Omnitrophota bacterium]